MTVVEDVSDDEREIALEDAQKHGPRSRARRRARLPDLLAPDGRREGAPSRTKSSATSSSVKQARTAFGRIAAQTAKQVLIQRVRDAERDLIFNEFKDRKGELIRGIVRRFEKGNNIIVDLGTHRGRPARSASRRRARRTARATASSPT